MVILLFILVQTWNFLASASFLLSHHYSDMEYFCHKHTTEDPTYWFFPKCNSFVCSLFCGFLTIQWLIKQMDCMVSIWVWNLTLKDLQKCVSSTMKTRWLFIYSVQWHPPRGRVELLEALEMEADSPPGRKFKHSDLWSYERGCKGSHIMHLRSSKLILSHLPRGEVLKDTTSPWNRDIMIKKKGGAARWEPIFLMWASLSKLADGSHYINRWFTEIEWVWLKWYTEQKETRQSKQIYAYQRERGGINLDFGINMYTVYVIYLYKIGN